MSKLLGVGVLFYVLVNRDVRLSKSLNRTLNGRRVVSEITYISVKAFFSMDLYHYIYESA